jgi:hypothetical protein
MEWAHNGPEAVTHLVLAIPSDLPLTRPFPSMPLREGREAGILWGEGTAVSATAPDGVV